MISIIIPVYNREAYIRECVESIWAQTYGAYELLLVDDGSTDATVEICRELAGKDERIRLIQMQHGGVSAARNKGLEEARGTYCFFQDSDDVIHPRLLETFVHAMENSDAPIAGTSVIKVPENYWQFLDYHISRQTEPGKITYQNHQESLRSMFSANSPLGMMGGIMMRREWIGDTRFRTDLSIGEDFYFVYENLIKGASTIFLKQSWYFLRLHDANSSWNYGYSGYVSRFNLRKMVWESEEALGRPEYANHQKRQVFDVFLRMMRKNKPGSEDSKKIRQHIKAHRKELFPALSMRTRLRYYLYIYMPYLAQWLSHKKKQVTDIHKKQEL